MDERISLRDPKAPRAAVSLDPGQSDTSILLSTIKPEAEDLALCFFIRRFLSGLQTPVIGIHGIVDDLYKGNSPTSPPLKYSLQAASLACFAHFEKRPELIGRSRRAYGNALSCINRALNDVRGAADNATMVSVLVMALFELITGNDDGAADAWKQHIDGVALLLQFHDVDGAGKTTNERLMLGDALTMVIPTFIENNTPISKHILSVIRSLRTSNDGIANAMANLETMIEIGQHIIAASEVDESRKDEVEASMSRLIELDKKLDSNFQRSMGTGLGVVDCRDPELKNPLVYRGTMAVYQDFRIARVWNVFHSIRIAVHIAVCRAVSARICAGVNLEPEELKRYEISARMIDYLCEGICTSVPQQLGYAQLYQPGRATDGCGQGKTYIFSKALGINIANSVALISPLRVAGSVKAGSVRLYCSRVLNEIATVGGIGLAGTYARALIAMELGEGF